MLVFLQHLITPEGLSTSPRLPIAVERPAVETATVDREWPFRVRAIPSSPPSEVHIVKVGRKRVKFAPSWAGERVNVGPVGPDGSVLVCRDSTDIAWRRSYSIYWKGEERSLPLSSGGEVTAYYDRNNFAGQIQARYAGGPPSAPPDAYVFEKGQFRYLGPGRVLAWSPGKAVVAEIPVDNQGRPASYDAWNKDVLRVYDRGRAYDLGVVKYVGRQSDGSIVVAAWRDEGVSLFRWKAGSLTPWGKLPKGWEPSWLTPDGSLLVRFGDKPGWKVGWLLGRTIRPIRFTRPLWTKDFGLGEAVWAQENGKFRTKSSGFKGKKELWYDLIFIPT